MFDGHQRPQAPQLSASLSNDVHWPRHAWSGGAQTSAGGDVDASAPPSGGGDVDASDPPSDGGGDVPPSGGAVDAVELELGLGVTMPAGSVGLTDWVGPSPGPPAGAGTQWPPTSV
jgi:hypothetical protein